MLVCKESEPKPALSAIKWSHALPDDAGERVTGGQGPRVRVCVPSTSSPQLWPCCPQPLLRCTCLRRAGHCLPAPSRGSSTNLQRPSLLCTGSCAHHAMRPAHSITCRLHSTMRPLHCMGTRNMLHPPIVHGFFSSARALPMARIAPPPTGALGVMPAVAPPPRQITALHCPL